MRALEPRDLRGAGAQRTRKASRSATRSRTWRPAVSAGRGSLYDTDEAPRLLALLLALATPATTAACAPCSPRLFGYDAAGAAGARQTMAKRSDAGSRTLADWRLRWETHGPQPMLAEVLAREAQRLLRYSGGERQLTHLSQLAEQLQEARAHRPGTTRHSWIGCAARSRTLTATTKTSSRGSNRTPAACRS
jgi:exodeoxyribonuclease V beta subunit